MKRLSDDYYHRQCYFKKEQVPTQSVMKDKMCTNLALVYFKQMTPKLKILAGLEPPMMGGGSEWFQPPDELLAGRAVLTPVKKEHLKQLSYQGIQDYGERMMHNYHRALLKQKKEALIANDNEWKKKILENCKLYYTEFAEAESTNNTKRIRNLLVDFERLYRRSIDRIELIVMQAAIAELERIRTEAYQHMQNRFAQLMKRQATMLYNEFSEKLENKKTEMKNHFMQKATEIRSNMGKRVHDIKAEKYLAVEKTRHFLECQTLACQVYVALKEREECRKEIEETKRTHQKTVASLKEDIAMKDYNIRLETEKYLKRQEFDRVWRQKICHIVKKFQIFVELCLKNLPEYADFFLDMEKLMMMQLNEVVEEPEAESIFIQTEPERPDPVARPHPFYLCCDRGYRAKVDEKLCPKHCTSSASQMPVVIINKNCMYSACDNLEVYGDKLAQYLAGNRGRDEDVRDDGKYELYVPVKYNRSTELQELNLESSLMQIIQQEIPNPRNIPIECPVCKIDYCFCSPLRSSKMSSSLKPEPEVKEKVIEVQMISSGHTMKTRSAELRLQREPKWESYVDFVMPKRCRCAKMSKRHLEEHLPVYMRKMSPYEPPELPNYETCTPATLRRLVKRARGIRTPPPPVVVESRTREMGTQYEHELDLACTCYSDDDLEKFLERLYACGGNMADVYGDKSHASSTQCEVVDGSVSATAVDKTASSFATDRAFSLRKFLDKDEVMHEIFSKKDCNYN